MHGQVSQDTQVGVPATVIWDVYRGLELGKLVDKLLGDVIGKVELVEGDGGIGSVMKVTFPPGALGRGYMKERFIYIDDEERIKKTELIEGGFKDLGFLLYKIHLQIIEKDAESSIVRSTIEYEVEEKLAENASLVTTKPLEMIAETIGKYLAEKKNSH